MKHVLNIFALIFSALLLFSCEPSRDENGDYLFGVNPNPNTNPGGGTSGNLKNLKSVTFDDGSGEKVTYNYTYAADKLIGVTTSDNSVSYTILYDNNLIDKITVVQDDTGITTTDFTLTYNNGQLVEAKGVGSEEGGNSFTNTLTATHTNNMVSKVLSKMVGIDSADPTVTYELFTLQSDITYAGNNISSWKFTTLFPATVPLPAIVLTSTFSDYDNKKNPFNTLPEAFNIVSSLYGLDSTAVTGFSANNYGKVTVASDSDSQSATYTYTYDADGYPTKAVASNNLGTLTFTYQ